MLTIPQLKAHHPARLFISPNLPVDENNNVATSPGEAMSGEPDPLDQSAPPTYGSHLLDQLVPLYEGIDPAGYLTPGQRSGSHTPSFSTFASRNASYDNLASLAMTGTDPNSPNAATLRNRLRNLQRVDDHSPTEEDVRRETANSYFGHGTPPNGQIRDRHHAGHAESPEHEDAHEHFDMYALGRMPSYNTAVKQNPRAIHSDTPPTYIVATSRPPSPQLPSLTHLPQAHLRSGHATPLGRPH